MPELPEVERAAALLRFLSLRHRISKVETTEDAIVFAGITHEEFATELTGRKVMNVGRYGKVFYIELDGKGRMPVLHFGMTGMLQVRGQLPIHYRETPKKASTEWPPKYMKFILHIKDDTTDSITEVAFLDARRLGRVRLCASPLTEPPISTLGFDPILSMPDLAQFQQAVLKRSCPIKALLLDQSFSAGVGNWVADEILYHARIHPERRCNSLINNELNELYMQTISVCTTAVSVNADDSKFPDNWLFKHRWGKGKKEKHSLKLPSGDLATIKWVTVGGRTSAFVAELQRLTSDRDDKLEPPAEDEDSESDLTPLEDEEPTETHLTTQTGIATRTKRKVDVNVNTVRLSISHLCQTAEAVSHDSLEALDPAITDCMFWNTTLDWIRSTLSSHARFYPRQRPIPYGFGTYSTL